jgi:hypothetical protein
LEKSPHVSEPNISALQQTADRCAPRTTTLPLGRVCPSAQSLLNASASSLLETVMFVMTTSRVLMTFQPSRLVAVSMVRWSE